MDEFNDECDLFEARRIIEFMIDVPADRVRWAGEVLLRELDRVEDLYDD